MLWISRKNYSFFKINYRNLWKSLYFYSHELFFLFPPNELCVRALFWSAQLGKKKQNEVGEPFLIMSQKFDIFLFPIIFTFIGGKKNFCQQFSVFCLKCYRKTQRILRDFGIQIFYSNDTGNDSFIFNSIKFEKKKEKLSNKLN